MEEQGVRQWIQYPLEEDLEQSFYCSDLFGNLPPPLPAVAITAYGSGSGSGCGASKKKTMMTKQMFASPVEMALAMGADRALGALVPPGLDTFGKVRTSSMHFLPPPLDPIQVFEGSSSSPIFRSNVAPSTLPPSPLPRLKTKLSPLIDSASDESPPEVSLSRYSSQKILKAVSPTGKRKPSFPSQKDQSENAERESTASERIRTQTTSKRSRIAEVHNLSEQRRRKRINDKLRALQDLIPNSNKTDKASMLDEAIEYLKLLQAQLQMMVMMSGTHVSPMLYNQGLGAMHVPHMNPMQFGMSVAGPGMGGFGMMDMMIPGRMTSPGHPLISFYPTQKNYVPPVTTANMDSLVTSGAPHYIPNASPHPGQFQVSSTQGIQPVNMDAYNAYLQHQQCAWQQQEHGHGQEQLSTLQEESTLVNDSFPNG